MNKSEIYTRDERVYVLQLVPNKRASSVISWAVDAIRCRYVYTHEIPTTGYEYWQSLEILRTVYDYYHRVFYAYCARYELLYGIATTTYSRVLCGYKWAGSKIAAATTTFLYVKWTDGSRLIHHADDRRRSTTRSTRFFSSIHRRKPPARGETTSLAFICVSPSRLVDVGRPRTRTMTDGVPCGL